jgi:hypothetical protein
LVAIAEMWRTEASRTIGAGTVVNFAADPSPAALPGSNFPIFITATY